MFADLFLGDYAETYPGAVYVGPKDLVAKRPDVPWVVSVTSHSDASLGPLQDDGLKIAWCVCVTAPSRGVGGL